MSSKVLTGADFSTEEYEVYSFNHGFLLMFTTSETQKIEPLFATLKCRRFWMDKNKLFDEVKNKNW